MAISRREEPHKLASGVVNAFESETLDLFVVLVIVSSLDPLEILPFQVLPAAFQV
jgi:hypothetical protein